MPTSGARANTISRSARDAPRRSRATSRSNGVSAARIRTISYGKERPIAICDDISCWIAEPPRADGAERRGGAMARQLLAAVWPQKAGQMRYGSARSALASERHGRMTLNCKVFRDSIAFHMAQTSAPLALTAALLLACRAALASPRRICHRADAAPQTALPQRPSRGGDRWRAHRRLEQQDRRDCRSSVGGAAIAVAQQARRDAAARERGHRAQAGGPAGRPQSPASMRSRRRSGR